MATKRINLFAKILDEKEPFLEFEDFGLKFFHPQDLPKSATLKIVEINENIEFLTDSRLSLAKEYEALRDVESGVIIDKANKKQRDTIYTKLRSFEKDIQKESLHYLEVLSKLPQGELENKIDELYANKNSPLYVIDGKKYETPLKEKEDLIENIFTEVNGALAEFTKQESGKIQESKGFEKKETAA
jgi:hypothetical protein